MDNQQDDEQIKTAIGNSPPSSYYHIDTSKQYLKSNPQPTQDLIALYGLERLADSVARINADGTKGVKLRKSYKAHITELTGKHNISDDKTYRLSGVTFAPDREGVPIEIKNFDSKLLNYNISFGRTSESGIPGFDPINLAIGEGTTAKRKMKGQSPEDPKRRRME